MDAGLLLQYVIIAVAVLASAWYVLRTRAPRTVRRLRVAVAVPLVRAHNPAWLRMLGRRIAPPATEQGASCKTDCGGCG